MHKGFTGFFQSKLFRNVCSLSLLKGFDYLMPLILIPFLFRTLGLEMFGLVSFSQAFVSYFMMVSEFGFDFSATHYIASNIADKEKVSKAYNSVLLVKLILCIAGFAAVLGIIAAVPKFGEHPEIYIYNYGIVLGSVLLPVWFFQAVEQMRFITYLAMGSRLLAIVPMFFLVREPQDYLIVPALYSIGSITAGILGLIVVRFKFGVRFRFPGFREMFGHAWHSAHFFLAKASVSVYGTTGTFVLGLVAGNEATGIFACAQKVMNAYNGVISPLQQAIYPYMIRTRNLLVFRRVLAFASGFNTVLVTVVILLSAFIVRILFKTDNIQIVEILQLMMVKCYASIPTILLGYPLLGVFRSPKLVNNTTVLASISYLVLLALVWALGWVNIYSMAILIVVTEFIMLASRLYLLRGSGCLSLSGIRKA